MKFSELNLNEKSIKGIKDAGFEECMPVQEKTFPHTFTGNDVMVQSQTGTGKTAAFLISIFHLLMKDEPSKRGRALIITPTRELAEQIGKEAKLLGRHTGVTVGTFYGGVGYEKQEKLFREGVNIIVGTPGRLIDFSDSGKLNLKEISILVIDEADRLFDMGFLPDIKKMLKKMPSKTRRQTMLFGATLDYQVRNIASDYLNNPMEIDIEPEHATVENISQKLYHVRTDEKINLLLGILEMERPQNAIIFTNTKHKAVDVAKRLEHNGYNCQYIIGDLPQKKRLQVIENMKNGKIPYLIASDVASRGLHIDDLEMVINYDLPENPESYVHRIGRTARVGKSGIAISLVCEKFVYGIEAIESFINMKIPIEFADEELFKTDRAARLRFSNQGMRSGQRERTSRNKSTRKKSADKPVRKQYADMKKKKDAANGTAVKPRTGIDTKKKQGPPKTAKKQIDVTKQKAPAQLPKNASMEKRLDYYSRKYGEKFNVVTEPVKANKTKKKKFITKILKGFLKNPR